jgi:hypothetical protein
MKDCQLKGIRLEGIGWDMGMGFVSFSRQNVTLPDQYSAFFFNSASRIQEEASLAIWLCEIFDIFWSYWEKTKLICDYVFTHYTSGRQL